MLVFLGKKSINQHLRTKGKTRKHFTLKKLLNFVYFYGCIWKFRLFTIKQCFKLSLDTGSTNN